MMKSQEDGITHINIYSKGKTELGRLLSNFSKSPIETVDGHFESIEGYWYWLSVPETEPERDKLRNAWGFQAKDLGRKLRGKDWVETEEFKEKIKNAIDLKVRSSSRIQELLEESTLPFVHYYVFGGKVIEPASGKWIIEYLEETRTFIKSLESNDSSDELPGMWDKSDFTGGRED